MKRLILTCMMAVAGLAVATAQIPSMNPGGAGDLINTFAKKALSDDAMTDEFGEVGGDFLKSAKDISTLASVKEHVSKLVGFIKPGMFKEGVDPQQLMDAANSAKSIAEATGVLGDLQNGLLKKAFKGSWSDKKANKFLDMVDLMP